MIEGQTLLSPKVVYKKPYLTDKNDSISNMIGLDSEAYTTGEPFMFCTSLHEILLPRDIPEVFFEDRYINANFMLYNIKYDSGALLYHLPLPNLTQLWETGETEHNGIAYENIPKKLLRLRKGRDMVSFWDIAQFYKMSLDKAAQTYLNDKKQSIRTKNFTPQYVSAHFQSIARYCIQDAVLTQKLGQYLVDKLKEFSIQTSKLYSCASISFKYFCTNSKVVPAWRFWEHHKRLLVYACDAYEGGKFEVTARGYHPDIYEYDITSAYPHEIANLVDISKAEVIYSPKYHPDAVYGYLRCHIKNPHGLHLPCGLKRPDGVRTYPAGEYYLTITRSEYDYLIELGLDVEIIDGAWLFTARRRYPYRKLIRNLFSIKDQYKGKDKMLYSVTKIIMNSFYGKMAQCIEKDGQIVLGRGWNPMYASEVTANTRIKVSRIQNELKDHCFAVHTDSVMTDRPIPRRYIQPGKLGYFEPVLRGPGLIVACGMYQIADQSAFKGFITRPGDSWLDIMQRFPGRKKIPYRMLHVESWIEAMAKNHPKSAINVFSNIVKIIDLNCDVKRIWIGKTTSSKLLSEQEFSEAKLEHQTAPPKFWQKSI